MLLEGTVHGDAIVLDGPTKLPEGAHVEIEVKTATEKPAPGANESSPTVLHLLKLAGTASDLPADFAAIMTTTSTGLRNDENGLCGLVLLLRSGQ